QGANAVGTERRVGQEVGAIGLGEGLAPERRDARGPDRDAHTGERLAGAVGDAAGDRSRHAEPNLADIADASDEARRAVGARRPETQDEAVVEAVGLDAQRDDRSGRRW